MRKELPRGKRIHISGLSPDTTDESLVAFLQQHGLPVTVEEVLVARNGHKPGTHAAVVVQGDALAAFLNWAVNGDTLHGRDVVCRDWANTTP